MGFFDRLERVGEPFRDKTRDKTRDNICAGLQSIGVDARMAERGRWEEEIERGLFSRSLGVIVIANAPIHWVNVIKTPGRYEAFYYVKYGMKDLRLARLPDLQIRSVRKKDSPLVGSVFDLRWNGRDCNLGIIDRLNNDIMLKHPIIDSCDVNIKGHQEHRCWTISVETKDPPSTELWGCYEAIAQHLLVEWTRSQ